MDDKAAILTEVCDALSADRAADASSILQARYPFMPFTNAGRRYSVREMLAVFQRDGFIDRYTGARLVSMPALRLISMRADGRLPLPGELAD